MFTLGGCSTFTYLTAYPLIPSELVAWYTIGYIPWVEAWKSGSTTFVNVSELLSDVNPGSIKSSPTSIVFSVNPVNETVGIRTDGRSGSKSMVTSTSNVEKNVLYMLSRRPM